MKHDDVSLSRYEQVTFLMNTFACIITTEHYAVADRITPLSSDELDVLLRVASSGSAVAGDLRDVLLSDTSMEDILLACPLAKEFERHVGVQRVLEVINALRAHNLTMENLRAHVVASIRYLYVNGMKIDESYYTTNAGMLFLIDEYPERVAEITDFRINRRTNDAELIREALFNAKPLAEGTL